MASELAVAYVSIIPETSRLVPEFNRQVGPGLERSGREQGQRYGNAFSGSAGKLIGAASGLVAGAAVVGFIKQSVADLQRVEKLAAQTEAVIKSTGGAAGVSADHVADLSNSIEELTSVEAETVTEGANFLLTFKNIKNAAGDGNDVFDQTVTAMTDMSVAMGTDAKSSALQLGKALNDPVKGVSALAKVGITFTDSQKQQIAQMVEQNNLLGAQKIILGEVESQFGGSAEAMGNTTEGAIAKAKNALGNFGEEISGNLMPLINGVASAAGPAFQGLADNSETVMLVGAAFVAWKFIPPLLTTIGTGAAGATARVSALATATRYMQSAAGRSTADVSRMSAAMQVVAQQGGRIGAIGGAFNTASAGASRFATSAGLAAAAGKGAQIAGAGLMGALGGPFGVAVLAAGGALLFWMKKNQEAKAAAEANNAAIQAITETLDAQTGAVTENTIAAQAKILSESGMIDSAKNYGIAAADLVNAHLDDAAALAKVNPIIEENIRKSTEASNVYKANAESYEAAGISLQDLTEALGGNSEKYSEVEGKIDSYNSRMSASGASESEKAASLDRLKKSLDQAGIGAADLGESVITTNGQLAASKQVTEDAAAAQTKGAETATAFTEAMDKYNDSAATAEDRTSALIAAIDALNGNPLDLEEANSALNEAFDSTAEAVKPKDGEIAPTVNVDTNTIDVATEAGRRLLDVTVAQRDATLDAARAARDAAVANGDLGGAQAAATAVVEQSRQKFIEQIGTLGIVGAEAQKLADKYIGIPSVVSTLIEAPGDVETQLAMDILKGKVDLVPNDKNITVDTLDAESIRRLDALEVKVRKLPDGNIEVYADTTAGQAVIDNFIAQPRKLTVTVDTVRTAQAQRDFNANGMQGPVAPIFRANGGALQGGIPGVDSIPLLGMAGEHMLDVNDVRRLGGQAGVYRFRQALAAGEVGGFANGGAIERARANAQADDGLSYIWGDRDCSMFLSWIHSDLMNIPRQRLYTTYSLLGGKTAGLERGPGDGNTHFLVGVNQEHMAGTLDGVNVESGGAGGGVQYGGGAAGAFDPQFTNIFHLPDSLLNPQIVAEAAAIVESNQSAIATPGAAITEAAPIVGSAVVPEATAPQMFSVTDRLKKLGADLSSVAVDAMLEHVPFGLGESRFLTTPILPGETPGDVPASFPEKDLANQQPVTTGAPNWQEDLLKALKRPAVFDRGGVVAPGINIIDNQTGANEMLANVTGMRAADIAPADKGGLTLNIAKIEGANADEIVRKINMEFTRGMQRHAGRPF